MPPAQIKIIAFDEEDETLQGITDGHIYGTVVQNPYQYGYESVRILAGLARGDQSVLPSEGYAKNLQFTLKTGDQIAAAASSLVFADTKKAVFTAIKIFNKLNI